jgi:peptidoglycan/xylan/chitin deacetylase (PgdA/CDA1 family)
MDVDFKRVRETGAGRVVRLTYHEIGEQGSPYLYFVPAGRFREHLAEVANTVGALNSRRIELSFDDGHVSHRELAMPILDEYGLKATFFITAGWTGKRLGYMTEQQVRELSQAGHSVQSHGWSHRMLTLCTDQELRDELDESKNMLEDLTGEPVQALSAPNGRWNRRVLEAAADSGYQFVYTSNPLWKDKAVPPLQIRGRRMVTRETDIAGLHRLCSPSCFDRGFQHVSQSGKQMLRRVLGEQRYHSLWCKLAKREGEW